MANGIDVKNYVRKALKQGHSEKHITDYLKKRKYPKPVIDQAFRDVKSEPKLPKFPVRKLEIYGAMAVIAVIIIVLLFTRGGIESCDDDICFLRNAQECSPATLVKDEAGSSVLYEIKGDCVLEKSIYSFAEDEPEEVVTLFANKKMICPYTKNGFDEEWITSIVSGVDVCSGELRDAIFELKLAQYELLLE